MRGRRRRRGRLKRRQRLSSMRAVEGEARRFVSMQADGGSEVAERLGRMHAAIKRATEGFA